jgi:hypothetical protein
MMKAQGWYHDPYLIHEDRYFSDGQPTKLVRDSGAESYDSPPPGPPKAELAAVRPNPAHDGDDLRRADDHGVGLAVYNKEPVFWAILDRGAVWGPVN